jgi:glycosyltransferase involved in cell wall biosynthesis
VGCKKVIMHPSVALDTAELRALSSLRGRNGASGLRFVCVGNLFAFKGFSLALQAFAELRRDFPEAQLWVFGNGPERRQLDTQVRNLRVKDAVKFCESVPRSELLRTLASCDALVHPCLRGAISMACLEAMAVGLPVICLNLGGPAQQVDDDSGIKVSATSPDQVVRDLASAMRRIAASPELRRRLGLAAQARVRNEFSWEARVKHINEAYYSVIGESDDSNLVNNAVTDQETHGA